MQNTLLSATEGQTCSPTCRHLTWKLQLLNHRIREYFWKAPSLPHHLLPKITHVSCCQANYSTGFWQIKVHLLKRLLLYSRGLGLLLHGIVPAGRLMQEQRDSCLLAFASPQTTCSRAGSSEGSKGFLSGPAAPSRGLGHQLLRGHTTLTRCFKYPSWVTESEN